MARAVLFSFFQTLLIASCYPTTARDRSQRRFGDSCQTWDSRWFRVPDDPAAFLFCDRRTGILKMDKCATLHRVQKVFDEFSQRCLMPAALIFYPASSTPTQTRSTPEVVPRSEPGHKDLFKANAAGAGKVGEVCAFNTDCIQGMYCMSGLCMCMSTFVQRGSFCYNKINPENYGCDYNEQCSAVWPGSTCNGQKKCVCPARYRAAQTRDGFVCVTTDERRACPLPDIGGRGVDTILRKNLLTNTGTGDDEVVSCRFGSNLPTSATDGLGKCFSREMAAGSYDVSGLYDCIRQSPPAGLAAPPSLDGVCCPNRAFVCIMPLVGTGGQTIRWYYNSVIGVCISFGFNESAAAQVNANNFASREHCESYCKERCTRGNAQYAVNASEPNLMSLTAQTCSASSSCSDSTNFECQRVGSESYCCSKPAFICTLSGGLTPPPSPAPMDWFKGRPMEFPAPTTPDALVTKYGTLYAEVSRYFYDFSTRKCEQFMWRQQGGTFNNFASQLECESYCGTLACSQGEPLKDPSGNQIACASSHGCPSTHICSNKAVCCPTQQTVCEMPQQVGACNNFVQRYWYNAVTMECEMFGFTGCQGNANNFETSLGCHNYCRKIKAKPQCIQGEPMKDNSGNYQTCNVGGVPGRRGCSGSYECYFDGRMSACCPTKAFTCSLQRSVGVNCGPKSVRWYFDTTAQSCQSFEYAGCDGNSNNFPSKELCETYCGVSNCPNGGKPLRDDGGQLRTCASQGATCPGSHECVTLTVSGSNVNYCCPTKAMICSEAPDVGLTCASEVTRYYFNTATRSCASFSYRGCGGNGNNFATRNHCQIFCDSSACKDGDTVATENGNGSGGKVIHCQAGATTACPSGYSCQIDNLTSRYVCCGATDMGVCPAGEKAYIDGYTQQAKSCRPSIAGSCAAGYLCRFNNQRRGYYCCASTSGVLCPEQRVPFRDQVSAQPLVCTLGTVYNSCPLGYSCQTNVAMAFQGYCCSVNAPCPIGQAHYTDSRGLARACSAFGHSAASCPSGFYCGPFGFCCQGTAPVTSTTPSPPPPPPPPPPPLIQQTPPDDCPVGHVGQQIASSSGGTVVQPCTLSNVVNTCVHPFTCQWMPRQNKFGCCAARHGCPGAMVAAINQATGLLISCAPGSSSCPSGFSCERTTISGSPTLCCGNGQAIVVKYKHTDTAGQPSPSSVAVKCPNDYVPPPLPQQSAAMPCSASTPCPSGYACMLDASGKTPICCRPPEKQSAPLQGQENGSRPSLSDLKTAASSTPIGQTANAEKACTGRGSRPFLDPTTNLPVACSGRQELCPQTHVCQYSSHLRQFYCCTFDAFSTPTNRLPISNGRFGNDESNRQNGNAIAPTDGCPGSSKPFLYPGTQLPLACSPNTARICPNGYSCQASTLTTRKYLCCENARKTYTLREPLNELGAPQARKSGGGGLEDQASAGLKFKSCRRVSGHDHCSGETEIEVNNCCWKKQRIGRPCAINMQCQWTHRGAVCKNDVCRCPQSMLAHRGSCSYSCPYGTVNIGGECRTEDSEFELRDSLAISKDVVVHESAHADFGTRSTQSNNLTSMTTVQSNDTETTGDVERQPPLRNIGLGASKAAEASAKALSPANSSPLAAS